MYNLNSIAVEYGKMVSSLCSRMISNKETAEEAAQETWLEITRSINSFRGDSKISTWIYTIARRVIIKHLHNEKKNSTDQLIEYFRSDDEPVIFPDPTLEYEDNVKEMCNKCLTAILHCLDNDARLAYILRDMIDLTYDQLSSIFEMDKRSLRQIISRSRRKMRSFLNEECYLFNPNGNCKCRMRKHVIEIKLDTEFEKLRISVHQMRIFKDAIEILPQKNYWSQFM